MSIHVDSEIAALKQVIIHRPDSGISRVTPKRAEELLFDDIVHLPTMQQEHDVFSTLLRKILGNDAVIETTDLLRESLHSDDVYIDELLDKCLYAEDLPLSYKARFLDMDKTRLADTLISGYDVESDTIYFDPIPNFIFTRDIAVTVKDHIIITKAAKNARERENLLTRYILRTHKLFASLADEGRLININDTELFPPSKQGEAVSIEGGDIMMIDKDYLLIGVSERTTEHAFTSIRDYLFKKGLIRNLVMVNIPEDRSFMHIDTLFTRISNDHVACFKPIVYDGKGSNVHVYDLSGEHRIYSSIKEFFVREINAEMQFVFSGGGVSPYQEREQWTDSCNLVALRPGVAITYDRNSRTAEAFVKAGYRVVTAQSIIESIDNGVIEPESIKNTIITLPSGELSRARGGSHCMTCPIQRSPL
jgi:arginine deiminase